MEEKSNAGSSLSGGASSSSADPIRSRWMPKPEQILILESIFNSGMVNPPRDETVRIRKLLEKFGSVGDANVFYWFQNRRSRSRRRQRQLQASLTATTDAPFSSSTQCSSSAPPTPSTSPPPSVGSVWRESPDDLLLLSQQMGLGVNNPPSTSTGLYYLGHGTVSVYINGILSEVPRGPIDLRSMFGHDVLVMHSSGEVLPVNENGLLLQSLQMGESYYLIARPN